MTKKIKVTQAFLNEIKMYIEDMYSIEDMVSELNIEDEILKNEQVIKAIEEARIQVVSKYDKYDETICSSGITEVEYNQLKVKAKPLIEKLDMEKKRRISYSLAPTKVFLNDFIEREYIKENDGLDLYNKTKEIIQNTEKGEYGYLIETLMSNIILMQTRIANLNQNLLRKDTNTKFSNEQTKLQIKMMDEMRKTTLTIQQLVEPKKTVFVKGNAIGQQNNQFNLEKKSNYENELSNKEINNGKLQERRTKEEAISSYTGVETMGEINGSKDKER